MKNYLRLAMLAILPVAMVSCSDDDNNPMNSTQNARVMAVHASPDAPSVDLYVDDTKVGSNLPFPDATAYLIVEAGSRNVQVKVYNTSTTVIDADVDVTASKNYSVFAVDSVSKISAIVLEDNLAAPAAGKAHVRFIHLSPNAPAVNITLTDGTVVFGDVSFKGYEDFTPLDAGTYHLQVRDAATNNTVVLNLPGIALQAGKIYTVFAKGFVGGAGAQALGAQFILNN